VVERDGTSAASAGKALKVGLMLPDGDPDPLAEAPRGHARDGIGHVQVVLDPNTSSGVEAFARMLERLD
jgi:hypothetical protein